MVVSYTAQTKAPLIAAVKKSNIPEVERLLDAGEDINQTFKEPTGEVRTPLHWSAWLEEEAMAKVLLNRGSNPNIPDQQGHTPLHIVTIGGKLDLMRLFLDNGADVDHLSKDQATALHIAAAFSQPEMIKLLIDYKADVNIPGQRNWTALHDAAFGGATDVIDILLKAGADINARNLGKDTPLHSAVAQDRLEAADLLLKSGACPHLRNWDNMRPIDVVKTRITHSRKAATFLENEAEAIEYERMKLNRLQESNPEADLPELPELPENVDERISELNTTVKGLEGFMGTLQTAMDNTPEPQSEKLAKLDLRLRQLKGLQYRLDLQTQYNASLAEKLRKVVAQMG